MLLFRLRARLNYLLTPFDPICCIYPKRTLRNASTITSPLLEQNRMVLLRENMSLQELSKVFSIPTRNLSKKMESLGISYHKGKVLSFDDASILALEYQLIPKVLPNQLEDKDVYRRPLPESLENWPKRPAVVTIMGHVDHGKTTLLDFLRKTAVAAGEAGGITQHIGAFSVSLKTGEKMTFLDTPGHAAFSAMRSRGAQITDIVVIVVAADDGLMPQTLEAIDHAKQSGVPIIIAINKCDKPGVTKEKIRSVKEQLLRHHVFLEDFEGDVPCVEISALKGTGISDLEETIVALAEVMDLRGEKVGLSEGTIIESKVDKGKGPVATVLVQRGELKQGTYILAGQSWCKVRRMTNNIGQMVLKAGPSMPVEVVGWKTLSNPGDEVLEVKNEEVVKNVLEYRNRLMEEESQCKTYSEILEKRALARKKYLDDKKQLKADKYRKYLYSTGQNQKGDSMRREEGNPNLSEGKSVKELVVVIKGDVFGSVEAIKESIEKMENDHFRFKIIKAGVGAITEADIFQAKDGLLIGFNVRLSNKGIQSLIQKHQVHFIEERVIYHVMDKLDLFLQEQQQEKEEIEFQKSIIGKATILKVFSIDTQKVAGCKVISGRFAKKNCIVRVLRGKDVVYKGPIQSLKHFRDEVEEMTAGNECGISFSTFQVMAKGDTIECLIASQEEDLS